MKKAEIIEENQDLKDLLKDKLNLTDAGIARAVRKNKGESLSSYIMSFFYRCPYVFRDRACGELYEAQISIFAMDKPDAINLAIGAYSIRGPRYGDYPITGKFCPKCQHALSELIRVRCIDSTDGSYLEHMVGE